MIAYNEEGLSRVLDTAEVEGLIVLKARAMKVRVVVQEPTVADKASRRLDVAFVCDDPQAFDQPPYMVAEGREQELRARLRAAILAALDPRGPISC